MVSSKFWTQVDTQRKPLEEQIESAGRMLKNKEISGNRYRAMVQSAEAQMGQFVRQLRDSSPEFKNVLLAGEFPQHVEPGDVQRFINQWYAIYGVSVQPGTAGDLDFRKVNTLRDLLLLKYKAKPEVVKEGMAFINRKKLAAYVTAQDLMSQYQAIPKYRGWTKEQGEKADHALAQMKDMVASGMSTWEARAAYKKIDPEGYSLSKRINSRRNPARKEFWQAHRLLSLFYSDLYGPTAEAADLPGLEEPEEAEAAPRLVPALAAAP